MIKRLYEADARLSHFFSVHPHSSVASDALTETYGLSSPVYSVFAQFTDENISALIGVLENSAHISADKNADTDEISQFLTCLAPNAITFNVSEIAIDINGYTRQSADLLALSKPHLTDGGVTFYPDLNDVFALMSRYHEAGEKDQFIADMQSRINHGAALTAAVYENGGIASTASAVFIGRKTGLIGAVATDSNYRGRGYASALVSSLCDKLINQNKTPLISCANEAAKRLYMSLGFVKTDERVTLIKSRE